MEGERSGDNDGGERNGNGSDADERPRPTIQSKAMSRFRKLTHFVYMATQPQPRGQMSTSAGGNSQPPPRPPAYYLNAYPPPTPMAPMGGMGPFGGPMGHFGGPMGGGMPMAYFSNPIMDFSYWAPYPANIPPGIPPGLAHLISVDCILVMQQVNLMELFISMDQTCNYMVLNKDGLCIFYAYETSTFLARYCCNNCRPLQIHIKDMYQNEMLYMNRTCTCTTCPSIIRCCCVSAFEVYTMPYTPIGAIVSHKNPGSVLLDIIDADENLLFQVHQDTNCLCVYCCYQAEFPITTIDSTSEIGLIRKQWGGLFREYLSTADVFTVNFPDDLDVKIKALFIGAMFYINYMFYE